jgi:NADP-dependent 3-hydroxy acid dehydrogenase YdfG
VEDWEDMIDTNNKGLVYMTRAVLPGMVERNRGHIINIGSTAAGLTPAATSMARPKPLSASSASICVPTCTAPRFA